MQLKMQQNARPVVSDLPDVLDALVLADGTKINPQTGEVINDEPAKLVEVPSNIKAVQLVTQARKRVADLPDLPSKTNIIAAIVAYKMFGLDDIEIALALGITELQVGRIIVSDAYTQLHDAILQSVLNNEAGTVKDLFVKNARAAATDMVKMAATAEGALKFRAMRDVLDRAGMRPVDVIEQRVSLEGQLQIVHIRRDNKDDLPTLNIEGT